METIFSIDGYTFSHAEWIDSKKSSTLLYRELTWSSSFPKKAEQSPLMPSWNIYKAADLQILSTGNQNIAQNFLGQKFPNNDINRSYGVDIIMAKIASDPFFLDKTVRSFNIVAEPCYVLAGPAPTLWGHFLYEYLPRLLFTLDNKVKGYNSLYISALTPSYISDPIKFICEMHDVQLNFFQPNSITHFKDTFFGLLSLRSFSMHRELDNLYQVDPNLQSELKTPIPPCESKIFISRKHKPSYSSQVPARDIINEVDVIGILKSLGFSIVSMEDLNFFQKIFLLDGVKTIVGGWGSGLINSVLSNSVDRVISLGLGSSFNPAFAEACTTRSQSYFEIPSFDFKDGNTLYDLRGKQQIINLQIFREAVASILP